MPSHIPRTARTPQPHLSQGDGGSRRAACGHPQITNHRPAPMTGTPPNSLDPAAIFPHAAGRRDHPSLQHPAPSPVPGWDRGGGMAGGTGRGCRPRQEAASARYATLIAAAGSAGDASRAPRPHARGRYSGTRNYRHRQTPGLSTARYRRQPPCRAQPAHPTAPQSPNDPKGFV